MRYGREWCPHTATAAEVYARLSAAERRAHPWVVVATAHPAKFNEIVEPIIGKPVTVPESLDRLLRLPQRALDLPPTLEALARGTQMNNLGIDPQWIGAAALVLVLAAAAYWGFRAYQRSARRRALLARLGTVAFEAVHQILVPDGMGGYIHIDHLLLTLRGVLILDTRRVAGL
jgi:hypothetical protein